MHPYALSVSAAAHWKRVAVVFVGVDVSVSEAQVVYYSKYQVGFLFPLSEKERKHL